MRALLFFALFISTLSEAAASVLSPQIRRSVREWTSCTGVQDDREGVAQAFEEAKNDRFILVVDCPVFIHVGTDISRPIFLDDGITVEFGEKGLFITDNVFMPTWVLANASRINLIGWRIEYVGQLPVDPDTRGYIKAGNFVPLSGKYQPAAAFHDHILTPWLSAHRGIIFDRSRGHITSPWPGPTATSAMFYILGSASEISIQRMKMFVSQKTAGSRFIPVCFLTTAGFKSNQRITATTSIDERSASIPEHINVSELELDGTYMGWLGVVKNATFEGIRSLRYGDLQADDGTFVGGVGKWFAPPHLFYLTDTKYADLQSTNVEISNVFDQGDRAGPARDRPNEQRSGYALSLKIAAIDSRVVGYTSNRPDGLLDLLPSKRLVIEGLRGSYDSSFLNGLYPGIRFPASGYRDIRLEGIQIEDRSAEAQVAAIGGMYDRDAKNFVLKDVQVRLHNAHATALLEPRLLGQSQVLQFQIISD
ncbi:hypothetical protein [Bradyrhizobium sp. ERR14]|uniref:hypothetical protein n=1 Tax=Bradyrhizobium sp. ERR14 TaxID=2663837 RepID=UPI00161A65A7|nr:hypothetical protein [Bradyrhizobium sp. ERR14]MBB4396208.1 hypothetical protein [Bradyrhizobium sp. ERR14]